MHTIEISAHARITLPCLALHAPLPPPVPLAIADNKTPTCFFALPALSNPPPYTCTGSSHWSSFFFFPCFTPVVICRATQHCSHNRIRSSTSFDLRRTATAPLNLSWKCPRPSCFEWEPPKVACFLSSLALLTRYCSDFIFQLSIATYIHNTSYRFPSHHMHSSGLICSIRSYPHLISPHLPCLRL